MKERKKTRRILLSAALLAVLTAAVLLLTLVLIPGRKLDRAMALLEAGEYETAYGLLAELGKNEIITGSINARADALLEAGDADGAYALLAELTDEESRERRMEIKRQQIRNTQEGKYFSLGRYEQDNKPETEPEPIEWKVLARDGDRVLVISRYILDCLLYDEEYRRVTWETCTLRAWLNGEFLNSAFDPEEQLLIPTTHVTADPNPDFDVDPGEDTEDKLFLLSIPEAERYFHPVSVPAPHGGSIQEAERYFHTYSTLWCKPTAFAAPKSNVDFTQNEAVGWWLRTPGLSSASAAMADRLGKIDTWGKLVNCEGGKKTPGVRPAMWIDLGT